ncbi:S-adenosyl-L-methionine-dependent methyltransferase [Thamnocephalis sphaerospora]|uniref:S-adenosyl-L-methionine-dependent methyltransferase n=1 Tax=Thamnocephalis sphaerospora TaxID=78915 RepID=A0A4P9XNB0_9FUNG|nr:S-adenosyl-L-methionine-dependent methyltransferase [Thamnocephalis sphaerospora]|eukprot:RKP07433.1 S-adenosyl-L-methionine-dependent methyltransferase [Thamnocephalis sphaerospora]
MGNQQTKDTTNDSAYGDTVEMAHHDSLLQPLPVDWSQPPSPDLRKRSSFQSACTVASASSIGRFSIRSNISSSRSIGADADSGTCQASRTPFRHPWLTWPQDSSHGQATRLLEGRTHVRIGNVCALLPSDMLETDNMERLHYIVKHVFNTNYHGDLGSQPMRILDVGTGCGIWMREMAQEFPESEVTGCDVIDLTGDDRMPKNCTWHEGHVFHGKYTAITSPWWDNTLMVPASHSGLPFGSEEFDFVHQRQLGFYIPSKRWTRTLHELHRVCRPGGLINLVELSFSLTPAGPAVQTLLKLIQRGLEPAGIDMNALRRLESRLCRVGFVDVEVREEPLPIGMWGGLVGRTLHEAMRRISTSARPVLMRYNKMRRRDMEKIIDDALVEMEQNQCSTTVLVYRARKPALAVTPGDAANTDRTAPLSVSIPRIRRSTGNLGRQCSGDGSREANKAPGATRSEDNEQRSTPISPVLPSISVIP